MTRRSIGFPLTVGIVLTLIAVSLAGVPKKIDGGNRRSAKPAQKPRHRYQEKIEAFIDRLQEKLGLGDDRKQGEGPNLSLTDTALLSLDAMQASIARCMLAAYPPDLLIEIPINTCGAHEFYRATEVIRAGEEAAEHALERFARG